MDIMQVYGCIWDMRWEYSWDHIQHERFKACNKGKGKKIESRVESFKISLPVCLPSCPHLPGVVLPNMDRFTCILASVWPYLIVTWSRAAIAWQFATDGNWSSWRAHWGRSSVGKLPLGFRPGTVQIPSLEATKWPVGLNEIALFESACGKPMSKKLQRAKRFILVSNPWVASSWNSNGVKSKQCWICQP